MALTIWMISEDAMSKKEVAVGVALTGAIFLAAFEFAPKVIRAVKYLGQAKHAAKVLKGTGRAAKVGDQWRGLSPAAVERLRLRVPTIVLPTGEVTLESVRVKNAVHSINKHAKVFGAGSDDIAVLALTTDEDVKVVHAIATKGRRTAWQNPAKVRCDIEICPSMDRLPNINGTCRGASLSISGAGSMSMSFKAQGSNASVSFSSSGIEATYEYKLPKCASVNRSFTLSGEHSLAPSAACDWCSVIGLAALATLR